MAKLVDNDPALISDLSQALTALLPRVITLKEQFIAQHIANLLWAIARLVDTGQELAVELTGVLVVLLPDVAVQKDQFIPQHIAHLLWAMAKMVDNEPTLILQLDEAVAVLLPGVRALKAHFKPQEVSTLMWSMAKLAKNNHDRTARFNESVAVLLPQARALTMQFRPRDVSNLLWALAKLVDSGQELTPELKETVAALLSQVSELKEQFIAQGIANLLWAMAKLLDNGQELTPKYQEALATLLPCVSVLQGQFNPRGIANLLLAIGSLGDAVSTAAIDSVVESMRRLSDKYPLFTRQELVMSLWGLLVCRARLYLANRISEQNDTLEYLIDRLFCYLANAPIDNKQGKSVMALAASWLGRACPVDPHYQTADSVTQSVFYAQLQSALPSLKIEQEKSLHFLPPVDLLLPEHHVAIEIQGPSHYVGRDFKTRNGSTLLKTALLRKAGYDVLEIPVRHLNHHNLVKTYIDQIQRKIIEISADDDVSCTDRGGSA